MLQVCCPIPRSPSPRILQSMNARIDPACCGDHKFTFIPGADGAGGESSSHSLSQSSPDQAQSQSFR